MAYLGLINFYSRFLPQAATKLEPLILLLKTHTPWRWGKEQESAFSESKKTLLKSGALAHFDPKSPLVVVADNSASGIGAVLRHLIDGVERPVCVASHTQTSAECNYAQLKQERSTCYCFWFMQISLLFARSVIMRSDRPQTLTRYLLHVRIYHLCLQVGCSVGHYCFRLIILLCVNVQKHY